MASKPGGRIAPVPVAQDRRQQRDCGRDRDDAEGPAAESGQIELPGRAIAPEEYRSVLLNRQNDAPLDGLEELIVALHDIGEVLQRPSLARLVRIARAAEQVTEPPQSPAARRQRP
jgi:hypothetical protein